MGLNLWARKTTAQGCVDLSNSNSAGTNQGQPKHAIGADCGIKFDLEQIWNRLSGIGVCGVWRFEYSMKDLNKAKPKFESSSFQYLVQKFPSRRPSKSGLHSFHGFHFVDQQQKCRPVACSIGHFNKSFHMESIAWFFFVIFTFFTLLLFWSSSVLPPLPSFG